jgi:acetylglutamate kinase
MRRDGFKKDRPSDNVGGDFAKSRWLVVMAQSRPTMGQQQQRQRAWNQQHIIEPIMKKSDVRMRLYQPAIDRVKRAGGLKKRIKNVTESLHRARRTNPNPNPSSNFKRKIFVIITEFTLLEPGQLSSFFEVSKDEAKAHFHLPAAHARRLLHQVVITLQDLISKAEVLLEALPYLQRFRGKIFVVKYGGSFMDSPDPAVRAEVARDIVFLAAVGILPVVIHGGGKAITRAMEQSGLKASFVQGLRVTDKATMDVVERVLSREINPEIVAGINQLGGMAKGFSGAEIFTARKLSLQDTAGASLDAGFLGDVAAVRTDSVLACLHEGATPVSSPTARGEDGHLYNCNADTAAAHMAIALRARRLIFMSDVPGVMRNPKDSSTVMPQLKAVEVGDLKKSGVIDKGMIPKVDGALAALQAGVEKVSFIDGRVPHAILLEIFTREGIGTELIL